MKRIYLDNAASSWPKTDGCIRECMRFLSTECSNVNRTYGKAAEKSEDRLLALRIALCELFHHSDPSTVILNSGITESINTVIGGFFSPSDHVITTSVEHNAVLRSLVGNGIAYSMIPTDGRGRSDLSSLEGLLKKGTKALVVTAGSNVTGFVEDLGALSSFARSHGLYFMVDSAQVSPWHEIDMEKLGIDALFFSGHKGLLGPEGTGGMILSRDVALETRPLIAGGTGSYSDRLSQPEILPDKFEAGTRNLPGLMGLLGSMEEIRENFYIMKSRYFSRVSSLREGLRKIDGIIVHGPHEDEEQSGVISISIPGKDPSRVAESLLEEWGIEVRVGLHCASTSHKALGTYPEGTIRFSPGCFTTKEEILTALEAVRTIVSR